MQRNSRSWRELRMTTLQLLEISAAVFGVLGTWLLARRGERAGWGFIAYLASNAGWLAFAWSYQHWGLLVQNIAFTACSLYGIWTWLLQPRLPDFMMWLLEGDNE